MANNRTRPIRIEDVKHEDVPQEARDAFETDFKAFTFKKKDLFWRRFWFSKTLCTYNVSSNVASMQVHVKDYHMDAKGNLIKS